MHPDLLKRLKEPTQSPGTTPSEPSSTNPSPSSTPGESGVAKAEVAAVVLCLFRAFLGMAGAARD